MGLGSESDDLPAYVVDSGQIGSFPAGGSINWSNGFFAGAASKASSFARRGIRLMIFFPRPRPIDASTDRAGRAI